MIVNKLLCPRCKTSVVSNAIVLDYMCMNCGRELKDNAVVRVKEREI
jgi:tRNA(Ile2) C34 agmatinyltransferase TiaS